MPSYWGMSSDEINRCQRDHVEADRRDDERSRDHNRAVETARTMTYSQLSKRPDLLRELGGEWWK
jgi:hypothetical protein